MQMYHRRPPTTHRLATVPHKWHNGVRNNSSTSSKVDRFRVIWKGLCDFLLVTNTVASISPKFEVEMGASSPPTFGLKPPTLRVPFLSCLPSMAPSAPFSSPFSLLRFPMFPPPILAPSSLSRGAPHPGRGSSQPSSVSSPSKSGRSPGDKWFVNCILKSKQQLFWW